MMYAQYCRIESYAGGLFATDRAFIRAALGVLKKQSRFSRQSRAFRHSWIREGLQKKRHALHEYNKWRFAG